MKSFLSSLLVILLTQICHAQYTEVINSRRPGFSDSPYSVGTKVYQVEGGLFYKNVGRFEYWDPILEQTITYGASSFGTDIMLRTGQFFEKLEFNFSGYIPGLYIIEISTESYIERKKLIIRR